MIRSPPLGPLHMSSYDFTLIWGWEFEDLVQGLTLWQSTIRPQCDYWIIKPQSFHLKLEDQVYEVGGSALSCHLASSSFLNIFITANSPPSCLYNAHMRCESTFPSQQGALFFGPLVLWSVGFHGTRHLHVCEFMS